MDEGATTPAWNIHQYAVNGLSRVLVFAKLNSDMVTWAALAKAIRASHLVVVDKSPPQHPKYRA